MEFDKSEEQWYPNEEEDITVYTCAYCGTEITGSSVCYEIDNIIFCTEHCAQQYYYEEAYEHVSADLITIDFARMN